MNKALFAALASVVFVGASCSVQDFSTVVMDKPTITASLPQSYDATITPDTYTRYYGKYSFRYGYLGNNLSPSGDKHIVENNTEVVLGSNLASGSYTISLHYSRGSSSWFTFFTDTEQTTKGLANAEGDLNVTLSVGSRGFIGYIAYVSTGSFLDVTNVMLVNGSSAMAYQPFAYGFSFDTPVTGAGSCVMDMYYNNGVFMPRHSYLAYNYNDECKVYTDGIHFDFGGNDDLLNEFRAKFLGAFASGRSSGFDWDEDYDDTELVLIPIVDDYLSLTYCEFYIEDRYQAGYEDGYRAAERDNGIFNHAYYVEGTDGTNTVTNYIDDSLLDWYASVNTQGLFDPYSLVSFLGLSSSATSYYITIQYGEVYSVETFPLAGFPLYVDVLKGGEVEDSTLLPSLTISRYRGGSIRGYTLFDAEFSNSYAGLATGYPNPDVYNREYDTFNRISLYLPKNQSYADMRQIGVVSPYAAGFADGVTSRNGEVEDLTEQILNLQEDLEQYQGKDYQQIYNLGFQAGLDENAQGAATFNSLFGNILTAPLTILNGLTDISFFGMPILTAILSLLMVAMALFLFKRFK